ncbi:hypothetical protein MMC07_006949 [Pseudocyphellaria aurata]|nr:hypothetical protein [Pseudocyphellaria aurata]
MGPSPFIYGSNGLGGDGAASVTPISGKIARSQVAKWTVDIDEETYCKIVDDGLHPEEEISVTSIEAKPRDVFSMVLNLRADRIKPSSSFLCLGGDSISAMQVISRCRAEGLAISVQDILRSKNISDLALCVVHAGESIYTKEEKLSIRRSTSLARSKDRYIQISEFLAFFFTNKAWPSAFKIFFAAKHISNLALCEVHAGELKKTFDPAFDLSPVQKIGVYKYLNP